MPRATLVSSAGQVTPPAGDSGARPLLTPAMLGLDSGDPQREPFELGCDTQPPDSLLGIQATYTGGDCLPGPPYSPGNLVGFAFPLENDVENGNVTAVKIFFRDLFEPGLTANIYIWEESAGLPDDACGAELFKLIEAPIQSDTAYSVYNLIAPISMDLGDRLWVRFNNQF